MALGPDFKVFVEARPAVPGGGVEAAPVVAGGAAESTLAVPAGESFAPDDVLQKDVVAFEDVLAAIGKLAEEAGHTLKDLGPDELELDFGLELGGQAGVPVWAKVTATGTIDVKLTWKSAGAADATTKN